MYFYSLGFTKYTKTVHSICLYTRWSLLYRLNTLDTLATIRLPVSKGWHHNSAWLRWNNVRITTQHFMLVWMSEYDPKVIRSYRHGHPVTCHVWYRQGSKGIALLILNIGARWGGSSTPRLGRFTPAKDPHVPTVQEAGRTPGSIWTCVDRSARSVTLIQLRISVPGYHKSKVVLKWLDSSHSIEDLLPHLT
jgi:hypothetical protein